ncbi:MAG: ABC transporter substrate-binding protein [Microcoleaceae cyanobacterium]
MQRSQNNEPLIVGLAFLITGGVLVGGGCVLFDLPFCPSEKPPELPRPRISRGETLLFPDSESENKQAGSDAFSASNYPLAVESFDAALRENKNDPETLIYLNNAEIGEQNSYQIAVAVPIGDIPSVASELLRGVAQAQTEINQVGGINGVPLKVWIADDKNDAEEAENIAETLSENSDILGVVGHYSSGVSLAASVIYQQNQLVMISPTSTSTKLSDAGDFIFRTVPSDRFAAHTLIRYFWDDLWFSKAAIFYNENSAYSRSLKDELITAISIEGGEVVETFNLSSADFDTIEGYFDSYDTLRQQQAEAIILVPDTATLRKALQIARVNNRNLPILAGDDVYSSDTLKKGEPVAQMVVAVPWHIENNRSSDFVRTANQLWGADINWRSAMACDATKTLAAAIATSPSRGGVAESLSEPSFSTLGCSGTIQFLPSGDRNKAFELVTIEPGTRSGLGHDFVPLR